MTWRTWNPDRRWLHPVVIAVWLHVLTWVVPVSGLSPWWMLPGGMAATGVLVWTGRKAAPVEVYGPTHTTQVTSLAVLVGALATGWLVWMGHHGALHGPGLGALVVALVVFGALYAAWRSYGVRRAAGIAQAKQAEATAAFRSLWSNILATAGVKDMAVVEIAKNRAGYSMLLEHRGNGSSVTINQIKQAVHPIAAAASRALAHTGAVIGPRGIRAEETEWAHRFRLNVTTIDVLKAVIEYVPRPRIASISDKMEVGLYEVGDPVELTLWATHGKIVGASRHGKSVLLNTIMARSTECDDVLLWVGATAKLIPLVYPWLQPWATGKTRRPTLDYVAGEGIDQVLMMLADMYVAATQRASLLTTESKLIPSHALPAIVGIIDEASLALTRQETIVIDGKKWTASELAAAVLQIGGAVNVTLLLATQYGLLDSFGQFGAEMHRNLLMRIALRTLSDHDGRATLVGMDNVDTTKLAHYSMLVQPNCQEPRALPAKAAYMEGADLIAPHAARNVGHMAYLDEFTRSRLPHYAGRWSAERQATLVDVIAREGHPVPDLAATERACQGDDQSTIDDRFASIVEGISVSNNNPSATAAAGSAIPTQAAKPVIGSGNPFDTDIEGFERRMAEINSKIGAVQRIDEPLRTIADMLTAPNAPKGDAFVSTARLAVVIDRVDNAAPDEDVAAAATQLGRDINKQCPKLKSIQRTIDGKQVRGYTIDKLWSAIHYVAGVKPWPADDDTE